MAYTITKKTEGSFDVYVLKFDQEDRMVGSLMYEKRILNQKNMGAGCISVKYSEKAYAFKLTYTPGSDAQKVMKKIEGKINVAAYFFGRHGNGMDDIFSDIFGGTFRRG